MPGKQMRMPDDHMAALEARGDSPSASARLMLDRYLDTLARARKALRKRLTGEECGMLVDILNGTATQASGHNLWHPPMLAAEVEDSLEDDYAEKWGCDGPALAQKLAALTPAEEFAIVDAVERFWLAHSRGERREPRELLAG